MELVQQDNITPQAGILLHGVIPGQDAQQFQVHHQKLALAVALLVPGHGGVGAPVVLEVEFAFPGFQAAVILDPLIQFVKVDPSGLLADLGNAADALLHTDGGLQHLAGGAAAAVTVTVGNQDVVVDLFILVALPAAHDGVGMEHSVVGGEEALLGVLTNAKGGDQVGQHFASVDAPPNEGVVGNLVELVPGKLSGHKVINAGLLHDLGQCAGVAEHVREPQNLIVGAELLFEEPLAVEELPDQGFAGGQVAVCFQPHAALGLPAAFGHPGLNLLKELGIALLQEVVQNRLAGHELVAGELLHELQDGGKGADNLLPGLGNGPPPGHVDMGVADAGGNHVVPAAHLLIQVLRDVGLSLFQGGVEVLGVGHPHIQKVNGIVQDGLDVQPDLIVLTHAVKGPDGDLDVVVELVDSLVQDVEVCQEAELHVQGAGVGLDINVHGFAAHGLLPEQNLPVVHVGALNHFLVDKHQELGVLAVIPLFDLGADFQPHRLAFQIFRDGNTAAEPVVVTGDAVEIGMLTVELAVKLVGACVGGIPVHMPAVELFPGGGAGVSLFGAEELAALVLPVGQGTAVRKPEHTQLVADCLNSLCDKIHNDTSLFIPGHASCAWQAPAYSIIIHHK